MDDTSAHFLVGVTTQTGLFDVQQVLEKSLYYPKRITVYFSPLEKYTHESRTTQRKPSFHDFGRRQNLIQLGEKSK